MHDLICHLSFQRVNHELIVLKKEIAKLSKTLKKSIKHQEQIDAFYAVRFAPKARLGTKHDNPDGPCACGAWHKPSDF
jgi:hypothetical protein